MEYFNPSKIIQFKNCRLFRDGVFSSNGDELWIQNGIVVNPKEIFYTERRRSDIQVDCEKYILAPGFLDLQVNGAFGFDFTSCDPECFVEVVKEVSDKLLQYGVTSFCPTLISTDRDFYKSIFSRIGQGRINRVGSVLGLHLEGPFISLEKRGCHPAQYIINDFGDTPVETVQSVYSDLASVSFVTIDPGLPGALEAIKYLRENGVFVSMGHSNADLNDCKKAVELGANCITHLFNAMKQFHHRDPGLVGLINANENNKCIYYGIIADGIHTQDISLKFASILNPEGTILVTDCISATGLGDGIHKLGNQTILVNGNLATVKGTNILAGSLATIPACIKQFEKSIKSQVTIDSLEIALRATTLNPAKFLQIDGKKGSLRIGSDADFVLLDLDMNIHCVFVGGIKKFFQNIK